ncbi:MAG: TIGR04084 family radical SAM/SPASM domain-containing protein [archaeon GB-1867-035]|nr:TIGR04084 family radical SAM/SPASM domain-containing protein [Candidatus Culexmicrobium profundum]
MLYIIFTTGQCNLSCKYCGGSFPSDVVPWKVEYSVNDLRKFIEGDNSPVIAFYGGEPLLNSSFIQSVMDEIDFAKFVIQTNGLLVKHLPVRYWEMFDTILLSIDGRREVTNYYRGYNVYERVVEAARWLKSINVKADIIARMTISERSDIHADVFHLLSLGVFDHIHWQLDVIWSDRWRDFDSWCTNSYKPGIKALIDLWARNAINGKVLGFVPFLAVLRALIFDEKLDSPPCGAGFSSVAIVTNGSVIACPIAVDAKWAYLGNIFENCWKDVFGGRFIGEPCVSCSYFDLCGGRCLYAYYERFWGDDGFKKVCSLTCFMIDELKKISGKILKLMMNGVIDPNSLRYPPFNNTTELIP